MKRVFSFLLVLLLVASLMPMQVLAETTGAHSVNVSVVGKGMVSVSPDMASAGQTVTVNCVPGDGMELKEITADSLGQIYPYSTSFTMPDGNVTVTVKFGPIGDGGDESYVSYMYLEEGVPGVPLGMDKAAADPGSRYTFVPLAGYTIVRVEAYDADENTLFVDANYSVVVPEFGGVSAVVYLTQGSGGTSQPTKYNVTVNSDGNGTASAAPTTAEAGDEVTVTTSPAEGYELDKITVTCGSEEIDVNTEGEFTMPAGDVTVTVTFKAKQTLPSGLSFSYAYDVWRDPDFPKKNGTFRVYRFDKPLDKNGYRVDNAGTWTLSSMGKYSSLSGSYPGLSDVADSLAREYGVSVNDMPIHKLSLNGEFVTYGVLVMHDASEPVAFFIGSNWRGGAGYLFCNTVYQSSDEKTYNVKEDVRDEVKPSNKIQITFDPNNGDATSDSKLDPGDTLNEVPSANRDDHVFTGWFTADGTPVTENTVFNEDTTVYARWAAHTTEPANNAFRANINMANQAVVDMLVTQSDKQQGQDVRVFMNVERLNTENVPSSDKTAIIGMAGSKKIAAFLDIQLLKQIGTATPTPIHNTETNMVPIIMKLDDEVIPSGAGKDTFTIIYHHVENGAATTDEISANFDAATKTLTFQANKFSTYALVVKEKTPTGTLDKVVKSGDISGFNGMSMLLLCCAVALAGVAVYDKKRTK